MVAEFVYCYLLRPWPLRPLANWAIRQLLPAQVQFGEAVVVLRIHATSCRNLQDLVNIMR